MAEKSEQPSLMAELKALGRQGAKDLHNAVIPAFPNSARSHDELGTPLNPTPNMVTQDLEGSQSYETFLDKAAARIRGGQEQDRGIER